jgi:hypothetical protein
VFAQAAGVNFVYFGNQPPYPKGEAVATRLKEYAALGIDTVILSGYPLLEEAYRAAELLFPLLPVDHALDTKVASYVGPFGDLKPATL